MKMNPLNKLASEPTSDGRNLPMIPRVLRISATTLWDSVEQFGYKFWLLHYVYTGSIDIEIFTKFHAVSCYSG